MYIEHLGPYLSCLLSRRDRSLGSRGLGETDRETNGTSDPDRRGYIVFPGFFVFYVNITGTFSREGGGVEVLPLRLSVPRSPGS